MIQTNGRTSAPSMRQSARHREFTGPGAIDARNLHKHLHRVVEFNGERENRCLRLQSEMLLHTFAFARGAEIDRIGGLALLRP